MIGKNDRNRYHRLIPEKQLFTGKDLTVGHVFKVKIGRDNSNIRRFLARFRRKTKVVSKSEKMVDLSLRLYHHIHDNVNHFNELEKIARSIFA